MAQVEEKRKKKQLEEEQRKQEEQAEECRLAREQELMKKQFEEDLLKQKQKEVGTRHLTVGNLQERQNVALGAPAYFLWISSSFILFLKSKFLIFDCENTHLGTTGDISEARGGCI